MAQAAPHCRAHTRPPQGRVRLRGKRVHRPPLRRPPQGRAQGIQGGVSRSGMGPRRGPGRLRRSRFLRRRRAKADAVLRRHLPLLERRPGAGVPRPERRVRLPGPAQHIRVLRRGPNAHSVRQRHRRRQEGLLDRKDHRDVRGFLRPLRVRLLFLQPGLGQREGQRGEQGRLHPPQPVRARSPHRRHRHIQPPPARPLHAPFRAEALAQGRAGGPAIRGGPRSHGWPAGKTVRRRALRQAQGRQVRQGPHRGQAPLLVRPGACGNDADSGARRHRRAHIRRGGHLRVQPRARLRRCAVGLVAACEPDSDALQKAGWMGEQQGEGMHARHAEEPSRRQGQKRPSGQPEDHEGRGRRSRMGRHRRGQGDGARCDGQGGCGVGRRRSGTLRGSGLATQNWTAPRGTALPL